FTTVSTDSYSVRLNLPTLPPARYPIHPVLTSSPTRRSSDLTFLQTKKRRLISRLKNQFASAAFCVATMDSIPPRASANKVSSSRSEEHTSELQSRFDLVCRLLLEKKHPPVDEVNAGAVDNR